MRLPITIRPLDTVIDVEHFQRLEQLIWASPAEDVVPTHIAITAIHNGGGLLGAFADDGPAETGGMVGLTFWFPGLGVATTGEGRGARGEGRKVDALSGTTGPAPRPSPLAPRLKMCSHMAGVLPAWQGQGLGLALKLAQRQAILEQGLTDWVTWTYDPLQRTNAVFNIHRLGAVCNTYKANWYGEMRDGLNAGTPSDRCQVDWWLSEGRGARGEGRRGDAPMVNGLPLVVEGIGAGRRFIVGGQLLQVLPTAPTAAGHRAPVENELRFESNLLAVPIPDDIGALRREDRGLGMAWRLFMRQALETAFAGGFVMVDCTHLGEIGWHYVLQAQVE